MLDAFAKHVIRSRRAEHVIRANTHVINTQRVRISTRNNDMPISQTQVFYVLSYARFEPFLKAFTSKHRTPPLRSKSKCKNIIS